MGVRYAVCAMYTWSGLVNITHDALLWPRQAGGAREFGQLIDACVGRGGVRGAGGDVCTRIARHGQCASLYAF